MKRRKGVVIIVFITALSLYFISESVLRQAVVSNIDQEQVRLEKVMSGLPGAVRDAVTYKIETSNLRASIEKAKTDQQKIYRTISLAMLVDNDTERAELYDSLLEKYPDNHATSRAYIFFLMNQDYPNKVSVKKFQKYAESLNSYYRLYSWQSAMNKLIKMGKSDSELIRLLSPLLDREPDFAEYEMIYSEMNKIAAKRSDKTLMDKLYKMLEKCNDAPSVEETIEQEEKEFSNNNKKN